MSEDDYYSPKLMDLGEPYAQYSMKLIQNCCDYNLCTNITYNISCGELVYVEQNVSFWQLLVCIVIVEFLFDSKMPNFRRQSPSGRQTWLINCGMLTSESCRKEWIETCDNYDLTISMNKNEIPQLVILVLLFVFITFGNTCVLIAIGLSETGRKTRMNFFIMNLAIADLTVGLFHVTVDIAERSLVTWYGGSALCKVVRFLQVTVVYSSTFMLVSLSIDRVDAIARPMNFTRKAVTVRALVYAAWATSAMFAIPSFLLNDVRTVNGQMLCIMTLEETWHWQLYLTLTALSAFMFPALIIIICYSIILVVIWGKGRGFSNAFQTNGFRTSPSSQPRNREAINTGIIPQAKIRTIKMTLMIVAMFVLCWCPYFVFNLLDVYTQSEKTMTQYAVTSLIQSLAPLNSAANPIIYGIFSTRICRNLRRIPVFAHISDKLCQCRLKRHHSPKSRMQSQTEQTLLESAVRRNGNKQNLEAEVMALLHHNFTNCMECKHPEQTSNVEPKNWKGIYKRRPSGLPLVNRAISEQDTLILQTYSLRKNDKQRNAQNSHSRCSVLKELSSEENVLDKDRGQVETANGFLSNCVNL